MEEAWVYFGSFRTEVTIRCSTVYEQSGQQRSCFLDIYTTAISAAIDFGQYLGIDKDFYGQAVSVGNAPDAGIAESIPDCTTVTNSISKGWAGANGNTIEWETNNDPTDHFEIEKSKDGTNFKTIATVPYKTNAASTTIKYQFLDNDVKDEIQYYRVKAVEPGNNVLYSQIVTIKNSVL